MKSDNSDNITVHFLDYWRVVRMRFPLVVLVFLLVVITVGIITYLMPRQYQSTVTMEVKENATYMSVFGQNEGGRFDPRFVTTQFEIIQRKEILYPVIEKLGLEKTWKERFGVATKEQVYIILRNRIDVKEVRNTDLIQISALSTDKREAMEVANAIAEQYQKKRVEEEQRRANQSLTQLEDEVQKQRVKVENLRKDMTRIRNEYGIQDLNPDSVEDLQQAQERVLLSAEEQVGVERLKAAQLRAKFEQISGLTDEQILRSIMTLEVNDPTIQQVLPLYQLAENEVDRLLSSGYGPSHPMVTSMKAKKDGYEKELAKQVAVLRTTLETSMRISEKALENLDSSVAKSRTQQQDARGRSASYYEAKNNYIQAKKVLEAAELRFSTETMQRKMPQSPATIWEFAEISDKVAKPNVLLNMFLGVFVGVLLGFGLAFFVEYLDTSVKTMEDVESFLQVPVLAVVPKNIGLLINEPPNTVDAEAYRIMRTNIEFNRKSTDGNTFTLVSGGAGEGKSTTLNNLAFTFARGGYKTLVIDADLRRPSQHRIYRIEPETGLSDFLSRDIDIDEATVATAVENLFFIPCGSHPADAQGILNSKKMVDLIEEAKSRYDLVFIDSPPILGVSDASLLASAVDFTVIVVQHRRFPRSMLQRVKQAVQSVGGRVIGVVLNNVDIRDDMPYQYYTNYYTYQTKRSKKKRGDEAEKPRDLAAKGSRAEHSEY